MADEDEEGYRPRKVAAWETTPQEPVSREPAAAIAVVVDSRGAVSDVIVPARWHETVSARDLGLVLQETANKAIAKRVAEQVDEFDMDQPVRFGHRADAPSAHGDPDSAVAENLVREALDLFANFNADLAAYTAQVKQSTPATSRGQGGNGRITVTLSAGQVSAVTVDAAWAASARHTEVRAEALSAFRAADQVSSSPEVAFPASIARLHELASDPVALSRQLGLSR
ncbi:MAG: hypothetical protein ABW215_05995 [Kibdelosporangium sp.]